MDCSNFLDWYSDFRDGLIADARLLGRLRQHVRRCESCARYDASVRSGVLSVREMYPSPDFRERLRERMAATEGHPMEPIRPGSAGLAAALMLAAAVALLVYERSSRAAPAATAPAVAEAPAVNSDSLPLRSAAPIGTMPIVVVNHGVPFVGFTDRTPSSFQTVGGPQFPVQSDVPRGTQVNLPR